MNKGMLISFTESDKNFDKELREWFVHEHITERAIYTPGFFRSRFYESINSGPKYFATYETENINVLSSAEYLEKVGNQSSWSKKVIPKLSDASNNDELILGHLMLVAGKVANQLDLNDTFRIVINNGAKAGQSVFHLHLHLLSGRSLNWPPG